MIIPSMIDPDMAPPGQHVMSCFVQYAPYDVEGGWDDAKREALRRDGHLDHRAATRRTSAEPIVGMQVITPKDIERIAGITGGNIFHGELLLHQIFFLRPAPQWADFRTPLRGYYFGALGRAPGRRRHGRGRHAGGAGDPEGLAMSAAKHDVIVVGAGHNGLVTAAYLAKAGRKVLVLERAEMPAASSPPGALAGRGGAGAARSGHLRPDIVRDLDLERHGLRTAAASGGAYVSLLPDGGSLRLTTDAGDAATLESIGRLSARDAARWPEFVAFMNGAAGFLDAAYRTPMPRLLRSELVRDGLPLASLLLRLRRLGRKDMFRVMRSLSMSAREFTEEWFESEPLKAAIGALAIHGVTLGAYSAGTGFTLIHNWLNRGGLAHRPSTSGASITDALVAAVRAGGGELRTSSAVERILVDKQQVQGVRVAGGEEIAASLVVSAADPRTTLLGLVGAPELPPEFVWQAQSIRMRGSVAKVHLLTDGRHGLPEGTLVVAPTLRYLEQAYDASKYGEISERPYLEVTTAGTWCPCTTSSLRTRCERATGRTSGLRSRRSRSMRSRRTHRGCVTRSAGCSPSRRWISSRVGA